MKGKTIYFLNKLVGLCKTVNNSYTSMDEYYCNLLDKIKMYPFFKENDR